MHLEAFVSQLLNCLLHGRDDLMAKLFLLDGEMSELLMLNLYEVIRSVLDFFASVRGVD